MLCAASVHLSHAPRDTNSDLKKIVVSCQGSNRNRNRRARRRVFHHRPQTVIPCFFSDKPISTPNWVQDSFRFYRFRCTWLNAVVVCVSSKFCGGCLVDIDGDCSWSWLRPGHEA